MGLPVYAHGLHVERRVGWGDRARKFVLVIVVAAALKLALLSCEPHLQLDPSSQLDRYPVTAVPLVNPGAHALSEDPETIRCYSDEDPTPLNYSRSITLLLEDSNFYNIHQWAGGNFTFDTVIVSELEAPEVRVQLAVTSTKEGCTARACLVRYENGDRGLGILPPPSGCPAGVPTLLVDVQATVLYAIPESASKPITVRRIMSELRTISQYFNALREDILIKYFYLMSTSGDIRVKDMATDQAFLYTVSGSIEANVSVSGPRSTFYDEIGGRCKANVTVGEGVDIALDVANNGGTMDVDLTISEARASQNVECYVHLTSSDGPLRLNVVSLPPRSPFSITHAASQSALDLTLPPTFEGVFYFQGYNLTEDQYPKVQARPVPDPEGKGRNRTVSSESVVDGLMHLLAGEAYWGSRPNDSDALQWLHSDSSGAQAVLTL